MKKFIIYWGPVFLWMIFVFWLSSRQKIAVSSSYTISFIIFKTLHIMEYAIGYLCVFRAVHGYISKNDTQYTFILSFCIIMLFAATDELHQQFVPTREGKVRDVIIDAIGAGLAWILQRQLLPKVHGKLKHMAKTLGIVS